jgi:hypothetical protein
VIFFVCSSSGRFIIKLTEREERGGKALQQSGHGWQENSQTRKKLPSVNSSTVVDKYPENTISLSYLHHFLHGKRHPCAPMPASL